MEKVQNGQCGVKKNNKLLWFLHIGLSKLVEFAALKLLGTSLIKAFFPWYLIAGALLFSILIGAVFGLIPARQAALLKPVDALRYE